MELDREALRRFVAVADALNFGRAAAALGIGRATLSRSVVELEAALGEELFVRPSPTTTLTAAGRALRARADGLLAEPEPTEPTGSPAFRVAIVPGVTVSKWSRVWEERRGTPLVVVPCAQDPEVRVLRDGLADVAFVRLPVDRESLSIIPLYAEVPVVVIGTDHVLTLLDEVTLADLVDEHLLLDPDTEATWRDAAAALPRAEGPAMAPPAGTAEAIALVAAGVGVVVVPQSLARLHHRKDVTYRPVSDLAPTEVVLAWSAEGTTPEIEDFVGIVRGRSARSSRAGTPVEPAAQPAKVERRPARGARAAAPRPQRPPNPRRGRR